MAKTPLKSLARLAVDEDKNGLIVVDKVAVPHTQIQNRAQIPDLANDMSAHFGINRIATHQMVFIPGEKGPNGEPVNGAVNDKYDQIRFVGSWRNYNDTNGIRIENQTASDNSFVEITFYGTALNILTLVDNAGRDLRVSVDGGAEGANIMPVAQGRLNGRKYNQNVVISAVKGLPLGVHTVRLRVNADQVTFFGFEVLNENTTINVNGGKAYVDGILKEFSAGTAPIANTWENEYGVNGGSGGCAVIYRDEFGNIKKDVQWADSTPQYMGSTDHSNEEIITKHNFREFGNGAQFNPGIGQPADICLADANVADRAFTLDDGGTSLIANNVTGYIDGATFIDTIAIDPNAAGYFLVIAFVGTGLDLTASRPDTVTSTYKILVDGVDVSGTLAGGAIGGNGDTVKICSGLPYGVHKVRVETVALASGSFGILDYTVYGPKEPQLADKSIKIAKYNLMADFVANVSNTIEASSTGVIRKSIEREMTYVDGTGGTQSWGMLPTDPGNLIVGNSASTNRQNGYMEYTFFGTGFDLRWLPDANRTTDATISLNGLALTTVNYPTANISVYGDGNFNSGTGSLNMTGSSAGFPFSGLVVKDLPLGIYTFKINNNVAGQYIDLGCLDIIAPVHSPKIVGPFQRMNTLRIGSQYISDMRAVENYQDEAMLHRLGDMQGYVPVDSASVPVSMADCSCTFYLDKKSKVEIILDATVETNNTGSDTIVQLYVNGRQIEGKANKSPITNGQRDLVLTLNVELEKGWHHTMPKYYTSSGQLVIYKRAIIVKKVD
jgi:hypothetical protein